MPTGIIPKTAFKKGHTPWNKNLKGIQPWMNTSGLIPGFMKDRKWPEKAREKISEDRKGHKPWNKGILVKVICGNCSKECFIHPYRKNTFQFCSTKCKGLWMSKNWKEEKAPNWQGGITPENHKIRSSIENRFWIEGNLARDNYTCQKCKIRGGKLNVHHIQNFSQYPEFRFAIDNGITFCRNCHIEFHKICGKKTNKIQLEQWLKNLAS